MSPEQARGREIDQRSDVFSAGAVFYYMLSGVKPFTAPDLPAVLHKVNSEDPAPLGPDRCPAGLWRILMKALAKDARARYADMGQLLADLVRFEQEFDVETRAMAATARTLAIEVTAVAREKSALDGKPVAPFSEALLDRYPVLDERGADALGVVPFRRTALTEIHTDLVGRAAALKAEVALLKGQGAAT
jgi:serine/threonine protein kinase